MFFSRPNGRLVVRGRLGWFRDLSTSILGGATTAGTHAFVASAGLPLHHCFEKRQLFINPIIHGPPLLQREKSGVVELSLTAEDADICLAQALLRNRSNCFYVYQHYSTASKPWAASSLEDILSAGDLAREGVVTIAGLGKVGKDAHLELPKRLAEAAQLTNLQTIDVAIVECDDETFRDGPDGVGAAIACLEELCSKGALSFYGLHINVSPYVFHTPPLRLVGTLAMIPPLLEESLQRNETPHADIVMYTISPTTALPATYPMLDPDFDLEALESKQVIDEGGGTDSGEGVVTSSEPERLRRFTRIGMNALLCRRGRGEADVSDEEGNEEEAQHRAERLAAAEKKPDAKLSADLEKEIALAQSEGEADGNFFPLVSSLLPKHVESNVAEALDSLCPALQSTPLLQDKAVRIVMSVGIDAVVVDAELSAVLGKMTLSAEDMLSSEETEEVFGTFVIPRELIRISRGD